MSGLNRPRILVLVGCMRIEDTEGTGFEAGVVSRCVPESDVDRALLDYLFLKADPSSYLRVAVAEGSVVLVDVARVYF